MTQHISIFKVGEQYSLSVRRESGETLDFDVFPTEQQPLLDDLLSWLNSLKTKDEQVLDEIFAIAEQSVTNEQAVTIAHLAPEWRIGETVSDRAIRWYKGIAYRLIKGKSHVTQADWTPDVMKSDWVALTKAEAEGAEIIEWFEPDANHNYELGQLVRFTDGLVYESLLANNVWSPITYPAGWKLREDKK